MYQVKVYNPDTKIWSLLGSFDDPNEAIQCAIRYERFHPGAIVEIF
jgi:hypothetical protein